MQRETRLANLWLAPLSLALGAILAVPAVAQFSRSAMQAIATPDRVKTPLGVFDFKDGAPDAATVQKVRDNLDFIHAVDVFLNTYQGANMYALRQGLMYIGVRDNHALLFSELIDSNSLFLTANADMVCFLSFVDLSRGPTVLEVPPNVWGTVDDMWWRWVIDFGVSGPDRGEGGRYLLLPPDYDGPLPEGGFYIGRSRTTRVCVLGRAFLEKDNPKPAAELIKNSVKIYRYDPDRAGVSIADVLTGKYPAVHALPWPKIVFFEAAGRKLDTIPPSDSSFFAMIHTVVQQEPVNALSAELMGQLAAIGIVKGKAFKPDARMKNILGNAAAVGNAAARSLVWNPRESEGFAYYPGSAWNNPLWIAGPDFLTPPSEATRFGFKPQPGNGARALNARLAFFYAANGASPTMCMKMPGMGSQFLWATMDADGNYFDGAKNYKLTLPKDIPQNKLWSVTVYDNQTRSMLQTPQRYPRVGSLGYPKPAAFPNEDGSTTVYFGPTVAKGKESNWIQTVPGKGWFVLLRLYNPLEPFFTKSWRPSEIELVK